MKLGVADLLDNTYICRPYLAILLAVVSVPDGITTYQYSNVMSLVRFYFCKKNKIIALLMDWLIMSGVCFGSTIKQEDLTLTVKAGKDYLTMAKSKQSNSRASKSS